MSVTSAQKEAAARDEQARKLEGKNTSLQLEYERLKKQFHCLEKEMNELREQRPPSSSEYNPPEEVSANKENIPLNLQVGEIAEKSSNITIMDQNMELGKARSPSSLLLKPPATSLISPVNRKSATKNPPSKVSQMLAQGQIGNGTASEQDSEQPAECKQS
ncbi:unnamed protein product [Heterosigma akashiwo]